MILYCDGFMVGYRGGKTPCTRGGFTVVNERNELVKRHTLDVLPFTNNHAEILGIAYAAYAAQAGDTIITDSQAAMYWAKSGHPKARMDLRPICQAAKRWIREKQLTLKWQPRESNLAGIWNETYPGA